VSKVITKAKKTYKDAFKVDIPVAFLRCHPDGAILNSKDKLADAVKNGAVLVACAPEDETATTSNSNRSSNMQSQLAKTQLVVMPNKGGQPLGELVEGVEPGGQINRFPMATWY
jgi:hypothetical protein